MPRCECGEQYNHKGVCEECGCEDDDYIEFADGTFYPFDPDKPIHYGDLRTHAVTNIGVMTRTDARKAKSPDLRRSILNHDNICGWEVARMEILKKSIKHVCFRLNLNKNFQNNCLYFLRKIKDVDFTGKKLDLVGVAIVYLMIRMDGLQYTLFDFKSLGYDTNVIYRYYSFLVIKLGLWKRIKRQNPTPFVYKFIDSFIPDDQSYYRDKMELKKHVKRLFLWWMASKSLTPIIDVCALNGNSGLYMIGACLYLTCRKDPVFKTTQKEVARVCGCSEVTLRDYLDELKGFAQKLANKNENTI